ncbi:heterocyst-inhibiting protein PatX [Nodularia chucula]|uniref:heterocyst-inhibiting protein PatX n=1 Tax=Nodularia chucula TaxID=3093667 RepID=UPI0039C70E97
MRATISLLVSSLVFSSLAFNCQAKVNRLSQMFLSFSGSEQLNSDSFQYQAQLRESESPILHRGSGRINS